MNEPPCLALDLGTTSVRALVVRDGEDVVGAAARPLGSAYPEPGQVEQSPEEMLEASVAVMREALEAAGVDARRIAGLGIVTQRSTAIAWDAGGGTALAPAVGWQDRRNRARVVELARAGVPIGALASATRFEWLLGHVGAVADAAARGRLKLGNPDAWLAFRLALEPRAVTDPGQAACTGLYASGKGDWAGRALALFGLERSWLPEVVPTSAVVGALDPRWLGAAVPLAARAGDQQAACFAQGIDAPGRAKLTLGTSAMLDVHVGDAPGRSVPGFHTLPLWDLGTGRAFCIEGSVITAAAAVDWLVELGLLESADALDEALASAPTSAGVSFVPALQGLGSPFMDDEARGLFLGLTRGSSAAELVRAVAEGIAHRCVDMLEALSFADPGPLAVDGGLARSDGMLQLLADRLGRPVARAAEAETTAIGAAGLARHAVVPGAERTTPRISARFEPRFDPAWRDAVRAHWRRCIERARG